AAWAGLGPANIWRVARHRSRDRRPEMGVPLSDPIHRGPADDSVWPDFQRRCRGQSAGTRLARRQVALAIPDGRGDARDVPDYLHARRTPARARARRHDADSVGATPVVL